MIPAIQEYNSVTQQNRLASYATLHQATVSLQEMGERTISTQVRIDGSVVPDFNGWELRFKGERFVLKTKEPQAAKDNTTRNSLVDLTFTSWVINELKRYYFFEPSTIDAGTVVADKYKASIGLNVEDFVVMVNKVLGYYFGGKVVMSLYLSGQGHYSTDRVYQDIDYTYIWDLLTKFYESFGVRWRIEYNATTDVYTIKAGYPAPEIDDHDFEYGYQGGLLKFERQVQDVDIRNILLGRGGEKNLPYRYFKLQDPQNPEWAADPDAIPELASITFDRLRDINFRWYVRGWMQNSHRDTSWDATHTFPSYTDNDCPPEYLFAFQKGKTDEKFNPVEYVKDDESIADYGERWGAVEDNDDVYPTIQGVSRSPIGRIDETVAVSEIVTDDIEAMSKNTAIETSMNPLVISDKNSTATQHTLLSETFTIPTGKTGNITYAAPTSDVPDADEGLNYVDTDQTTMVAVNQSTGTEVPISGIPAGTYRLKINLVIHIGASSGKVTGTFGYETIKLTTSEVDADAWKPTFDIWIKNIWNTTKRNDESEVQYAERVWLPILGDRAGNEAKVVFSTGFMSISEDYEFVIVSYPVHDTSKEINGVPSEWRITLRKSDAEFDATGLYIPNATTGGAPVAGDKFFFMGIDMPHMYVELSEEDLNTAKSAQLESTAATNKTWVINLDKVRCNTLEDGEYGQTLADRLSAGAEVWITDPRFTPGTRLKLFVQSITYTWNEPAENAPYIAPDIEVVLSDKVLSTESTIGKMQGDIAMVKEQYARISDVEAAVRSVTEPMFLKKTGESDTSASPTQFASKVTSKGFRQGGVGGAGWGLYRDNTSDMAEGEDEAEGDSVIEVDRVIVRKAMEVNSLVVNQIEAKGGKEILSAAKIEVTKVIENNTSYVCYFNQRQGSVANLFAVNDIAMGQVFGADNTELRYYKMLVTAVGLDNITLAKANRVGGGSPAVGDVIVQYGSTTNTARQYVIIRDVIGGGYERMISNLNALDATGFEYFFAGKQSGINGPKILVGDEVSQAGEYMRWLNGVLDVKGRFVVRKNDNTYQSMADFIDNNDVAYLKAATNNGTTLVDGGLILSNLIAIGQTVNNQYQVRGGINGMMNIDRTRVGGGVAAWYGGPMSDKDDLDTGVTDYAKTIFRFDGSGYLAGGNIHWNENGYGGIPGINWQSDGQGGTDVVIGANVKLASVSGDTVTDLLNLVQSLSNMFEDESYTDGGQTKHRIKVKSGFAGLYSEGFISAGGFSPGGGITPSATTLAGLDDVALVGTPATSQILAVGQNGKWTNIDQSSIVPDLSNYYTKSETNSQISSAITALGLGTAATYAVATTVSQSDTDKLVTGAAVWSAIDALPEPMIFKGSLGTGGTITTLPTASSANEGFTYKVITAGTYASQAAKIGDLFISNGSAWIWIPSGDEPSGTVTSVKMSLPTGLVLGTGSTNPITTSGEFKVALDTGYSIPLAADVTKGVTAYGYFDANGNANSALKLTTVSKTAWGQTFWTSGGIPTNISGDMSSVGKMTFTAQSTPADSGNVLEVVTVNGVTYLHTPLPFYSDYSVSAGGISGGGGTPGINLGAMWDSLTNTVADAYATTQIDAAHIPDMASAYGYLKSADLAGYLPLSGGQLTKTGTDDIPLALKTSASTVWVKFLPSDNTARYIGVDTNNKLKFQYGNSSYVVLHSGNYSTYAFPKAGGTVDGTTIYPVIVNNSATGASYSGIRFQVGGTTKGSLRVSSSNVLEYDNETSAYTVYHSGNFTPGNYLPLSAGVDKPLTGDLYFPHDTGIRIADKDNTKWVVLKIQTVDNINQTTIGPAVGKTVIRSGYVNLYHYRGESEYEIYTQFNLTKSVLTGLLNASGGYYLPLTGGTISSTSAVPLYINSTHSTQTDLNIQRNGTSKTQLGFLDSEGTVLYDYPTGGYINIPASATTLYWKNTYKFYHSGNANLATASWSVFCLDINRDYNTGQPGSTNYMGMEIEPKAAKIAFKPYSISGALISGGEFYVTADGNFGFGTQYPGYKMDVRGELYVNSYIRIGRGGTSIEAENTNGGAETLHLKYYQTGNVTICNGGGNAGIRTASPYCPLEVAGTLSDPNSTSIASSAIAAFNKHNDDGIFFGFYSGLGWIQSAYYGTSTTTSAAHTYKLNLNPLGGYVGINMGAGHQAPAYPLDVNGIINSNESIRVFESLLFYRTSYCYISATGSGASISFNIGASGSTNSKMLINNNGNVSIGYFGDGGSKLYVAGNIVATGAVTGGQASDLRLKTNIASMTDNQALAMILALRPVTFTWNQKATELYDQYQGNDLGFIAQEVELIPGLSKAIGTIFEDYKRLDPVKFIAPIVKVEQDHERRIRSLEEEVRNLKNENTNLRNRLNMN